MIQLRASNQFILPIYFLSQSLLLFLANVLIYSLAFSLYFCIFTKIAFFIRRWYNRLISAKFTHKLQNILHAFLVYSMIANLIHLSIILIFFYWGQHYITILCLIKELDVCLIFLHDIIMRHLQFEFNIFRMKLFFLTWTIHFIFTSEILTMRSMLINKCISMAKLRHGQESILLILWFRYHMFKLLELKAYSIIFIRLVVFTFRKYVLSELSLSLAVPLRYLCTIFIEAFILS